MVKKLIILCAAILLLSGNLFAQPPDSLWSNTFGGNQYDICSAVQQTSDGGYILAGKTQSFGAGDYDFWLVKTDANGDSLWSRTFGGMNSDICQSAQQTSDEGYILAGHTGSFGECDSDFWLVKTDADGIFLWDRVFGGDDDDGCYSVQQTSDGGYILAGYSRSFGANNCDYWLLKTNANGDSLWSKIFGGNDDDVCHSVQQTTDGGYILAGDTWSFGAGSRDFWLVKTDENGDSLWSDSFGGSQMEVCSSIRQTTDEGYILAGSTQSFGAGYKDCWIVKTNENGDSLWSRTFGGEGSESLEDVQQTADGGYILGGQFLGTNSWDFLLIRTDENGDSLWSMTFGGDDWDICLSLALTSDNGYILAGYTRSFGAGDYDFWLVKTGPDFVGVEDFPSSSVPKAFSLSPAYPNPFNPSTQITFNLPIGADVSLIVYDINGREVARIVNGWYPSGTHQAVFDGSELASGIYFAKIVAGNFSQTRKLVLVK